MTDVAPPLSVMISPGLSLSMTLTSVLRTKVPFTSAWELITEWPIATFWSPSSAVSDLARTKIVRSALQM